MTCVFSDIIEDITSVDSTRTWWEVEEKYKDKLEAILQERRWEHKIYTVKQILFMPGVIYYIMTL